MTTEVTANVVEQFDIVVTLARERFTDWMEEYLKGRKVELSVADKSSIEQLFSEAVHTYITAETAAFLSYLLYTELGNDEIVKRIVPAFLEECESKLERVPESMARKTGELTVLAQRVLEPGAHPNAIVDSLLKDIAGMAKIRHLRASFDAVVLYLMGEC